MPLLFVYTNSMRILPPRLAILSDGTILETHYIAYTLTLIELINIWKNLYEMSWGKDIGEILSTDSGSSARFIDFALVSDSFQPACVLVRDEYDTVYHLLEKSSRTKRGAVVVGQPGMGKSLSLLYFLVRRLSQQLPTAYQNVPGYYFLFDHNGVVRLNDMDVPPKDAWALTDSNQVLTTPSGGFSLPNSKHFLVQASSPNQTRYKAWAKERSAVFVVMDVWNWSEMVQLIAVHKLNEMLVSEIYRTWGPSARLCTELTSVEGQRSKVRESLKGFAGNLSDVLRSMAISGDGGPNAASAPNSAFYIYPTNPRSVGEAWLEGVKLTVPTGALRQECFRAMLMEETKKQQAFFDILSTNPLSRSTSGPILEKWMHLHFTYGLELGIITPDTPSEIVCFDSERQCPDVSFSPPRRLPTLFGPEFKESSLSLQGDPPYYLKPLRPNQATFDGVIPTEDKVILLQSAVSAKHPISRKGIVELLKFLPSYRNVTWVFVYYVHRADNGRRLAKVGPLQFKEFGPLKRYYTICPLVPLPLADLYFDQIEPFTNSCLTAEEQERMENASEEFEPVDDDSMHVDEVGPES